MPGAQEYVHRSMPNLMVHPFPHPPWPKLVSSGPVKSEFASVFLTLHVLVGVCDFACDDGVGVGGGGGDACGVRCVVDVGTGCGDIEVVLHRRAVINPNVVEFQRSSEAAGIDPSHRLRRTLTRPWFQKHSGGVTVVQQGAKDIPTNTEGASSEGTHEISKIPDSVPQDQLEEETVMEIDTPGASNASVARETS